MEKQQITIDGIPAVVWGPASGEVYLAVHGDASNKEDTVIALLAEAAAAKGYQTLSFDLPEHGARAGEARLCNAENCAEDLGTVLRYARGRWGQTNLFGCSIGAYFGMLAFQNQAMGQALFLSPVVDMRRLIEGMMTAFGVSEERLRTEGEVPTPAKTLYWDYYQYVKSHPVHWRVPTHILYGEKDSLCAYEDILHFAENSGAKVTVVKNGEHFFYTEEQLAAFRQWLAGCIVAR